MSCGERRRGQEWARVELRLEHSFLFGLSLKSEIAAGVGLQQEVVPAAETSWRLGPHLLGYLDVPMRRLDHTTGGLSAYIRSTLYICPMLIRNIATHALSLMSLVITLIFASDVAKQLKDPFVGVIVVITFIIIAGMAILDIIYVGKNQPKKFKGKKRDAKIRRFMIDLLDGDGRCVVSSNDLSWVEQTAKEALLRKAQKNSLELLMPSVTDLSIELVSAGAEAHYYGDTGFKFRSRFTIVNTGRGDAWVAVGMGTSNAHIIRTITSNADPVFHMATDLVGLAERAAKVATQ